MLEKEYKCCKLCARNCGIDRTENVGRCNMKSDVYISHYWLHMWEEPIISGKSGSGAIFFDGCSLNCKFCQNAAISRGRNGTVVTKEDLSDIMISLQNEGAHNINLVTPTHFVPTIRESVSLARFRGLSIPIVYNTSGYDNPETIKSLSETVDIYLPDFKYFTAKTSKRYSCAPDYPEVAKRAIAEMITQVGPPIINDDGMMTRGVIVRILLLPGHVAEAKLIVKFLYDTYGDSIYISLMSQYTPMSDMLPPLNRKVTKEEYRQLVDYADKLGVINAFVQDGDSAKDTFIPPFYENVKD